MLIPFHDDNPTSRMPIVTVAIIVINSVVLFASMQIGDHERRVMIATRGFIPVRLGQLMDDQLVIRHDLYPDAAERIAPGLPRRRQGQERFIQLPARRLDVLSSLVTSLFLHAGLAHLIGNMWFFWIFGNNIEDRLGHVGFLLFYLTGGIFASMCHWLMSSGDAASLPVIGASGAVAVILGAYAVLYPLARVRTLVFIIIFFTVIDLPALAVLGLWFFAQLMHGFGAMQGLDFSGGVAWWAHIGGFLFGVLIMPILAMGTPEPGEDWQAELRRQFDFGRMTDSR
jgi:membrane associated rhomboid family serine protease